MSNLWKVFLLLNVIVLSFGSRHHDTDSEIVRKFQKLEKKLNSVVKSEDGDFNKQLILKLDSIEKLIDLYSENDLLDTLEASDTDAHVDINERSKENVHSLSEVLTMEDEKFSRSKRQAEVDFKALGFDLETVCDNETMPVFFKLLEIDLGVKENSKNIDKIVSLDLKDLADGNKLNKDNIEAINENVNHIKQTVDLLLNLNLYKIETCADLLKFGNAKTGIYRVGGKDVLCDQEMDGGGWLVFQRRMDGSENFYRNWNEYKEGFGNLNGEFWLGNEYLSKMTDLALQGWQELRIDMVGKNGEKFYAKYSSFRVMSEADHYRMFAFGYSGNSGNGLYLDSGKHFSTKDRDNDRSASINCAVQYRAGWWYSDCYSANLNGVYYDSTADTTARDGIEWVLSNKECKTLTFVEMKFRKNRGL
ncbi:complement activation [Mactra antiquata]